VLTIKKAHHGEFRNLLSSLRSAALDNRPYIAFPKKKFNYLFILKQLQGEGFIEGYENRGEILIVHLKQTY
jgi:ribosomal protein S8